MKAVLALEDGTWFQGTAVGAEGTASGEVVFNTGLTGYQEILTDPSYAGQIVTMTCPEIGNYGVAAADVESRAPQVAGFVMRSESLVASNWRAAGPLGDYLAASGVVAIAGIDTRALTRRLRSAGVMRGVIGTGDRDPSALVEAARRAPLMAGSDLVSGVTCAAPFDWPLAGAQTGSDGYEIADGSRALAPVPRGGVGFRHEVEHPPPALRLRLRCPGLSRVHAGRSVLLADHPDGVFLSNGPGDPAALPAVIDNVRAVVADGTPLFGICLGHQVLGLALGARTFKLKFGHRGSNHPVKQLETGRVEITSQNHGFAVDPGTLPPDVMVTHVNLYDHTLEGFRHRHKPVFSVQYHPEASPGPHDADYLFGLFTDAMERR